MATSPLLRVLVALTLLGTLGVLGFLAAAAVSRFRRPGPADFIVVLGSTLTPDGHVPALLAARLDKAHATATALRHDDERPVILVSGGKTPRDSVAEAGPMAGYLLATGECEEDLLLEDQSLSTQDNLRLAGELMARAKPAGYRCVIVTNDYHCPRAAVLARRGGLSATVIGAGAPLRQWPLAAARDFAALVVTCWRVVVALVVVAVVVALVS